MVTPLTPGESFQRKLDALKTGLSEEEWDAMDLYDAYAKMDLTENELHWLAAREAEAASGEQDRTRLADEAYDNMTVAIAERARKARKIDTLGRSIHGVFCDALEKTKAAFAEDVWNAMSRAEQFDQVDFMRDDELRPILQELSTQRTREARNHSSGTMSRYEELARMNLTEEELWVVYRFSWASIEDQTPKWIVEDEALLAAQRIANFDDEKETVAAKRAELGL